MARCKLEYTLESVQARLKVDKVGVAIRQRGQRLELRTTLPPKPGSNRTTPYSQTITLFYANEAGIVQAEALARELGAQIASNRFDWQKWKDYTAPTIPTPLEACPVAEWVQLLRVDMFNRGGLTEETWNTSYHEVFRRLPQDMPITVKMLIDELLIHRAETRSRKRHYQALRKLARFAGLPLESFEGMGGTYNMKRVDPRTLPSDETVLEYIATITNPAWREAMVRVLLFGLRPSEAWFAIQEQQSGQVRYRLSESKTGPRRVYPLLPQWVERLKPFSSPMPQIQTGSRVGLGESFGDYFRKRTIKPSFKPYDLRHIYARRGMECEIPPDRMAVAMGHALSVHMDVYRAWVGHDSYDAIFDQATIRRD